jgi:hypothetical protein
LYQWGVYRIGDRKSRVARTDNLQGVQVPTSAAADQYQKWNPKMNWSGFIIVDNQFLSVIRRFLLMV